MVYYSPPLNISFIYSSFTNTSRALLPLYPLIIPNASSSSINLPALLYPILKRLCNSDTDGDGLGAGEGNLYCESITFEKENYADWTLAENQDRITDNVWITRKNNQSIFKKNR